MYTKLKAVNNLKSSNVNFRVEESLKEEFKAVCDKKLQDMSRVFVEFMKSYIEKNKCE
jgi:antitoxin component of RelBE/YafQ-DinJ toxin-antitoxin module